MSKIVSLDKLPNAIYKETRKYTNIIGRELEASLNRVVYARNILIASTAKVIVPRFTGTLSKSIGATYDGKTHTLKADASARQQFSAMIDRNKSRFLAGGLTPVVAARASLYFMRQRYGKVDLDDSYAALITDDSGRNFMEIAIDKSKNLPIYMDATRDIRNVSQSTKYDMNIVVRDIEAYYNKELIIAIKKQVLEAKRERLLTRIRPINRRLRTRHISAVGRGRSRED